ncbi:MAG: M48 family metalloprotease [Deltaproteobacteria bacterium]|nr:M48 family metalloprotease [Deltaproteobacteria bacterium]MBW2127755.1 M48 family metalloprotease [Deltaproteobacteria bacterium]MBW2303186.1 M48 family metalloprotease [Deltaproteobacteria bacterium]
MFNNIIYFLVVLLVFSVSYPRDAPREPALYFFVMIVGTWAVFSGYCRLSFRRLLDRYQRGEETAPGLAGTYQRLMLRLSLLAIFLFVLDVYLLDLKAWIRLIPGTKRFSVLQGILALSLFLFYQCTIWHQGWKAYCRAFEVRISRASFIGSNLRFNVPILFPWFILTLVLDLLAFTPLSRPDSFLNRTEGQIVFFAVFLVVFVIFLPPVVRYWWGCRPFEPSEKVRQLKDFLREKGFKYRDLLNWPIFEGRMLTAGIMGILPRFRYIFITDALMEVLSTQELKAVTAHEMGHARYRHLLFYGLFFLVYMVLAFGLMDLTGAILSFLPLFGKDSAGETDILSLYLALSSLPLLLSLLLYFRFVMGFFMRHFERQADLYSAVVMGGPFETIRSLEKIALLSGKTRDLPSWHHFSIARRVEILWRFFKDPGIARRHNRFVALSLAFFFVAAIGLGYLLNSGAAKKYVTVHLLEKRVWDRIQKDPNDPLPYQLLAGLYLDRGLIKRSKDMYERALTLDPDNPLVLNNLAWILATAKEAELRDEKRALLLAKQAVARERSAVFLDTLAEAYYVNGFTREAVSTIREALTLASENKAYYRKQLKRFLSGPASRFDPKK